MKNIISLMILMIMISLSSVITAKENSVKITPEKPKAGDEITVIYNPANTIISDVKNVEIVFSLYSVKSSDYNHIEESHNYAMTKTGDVWTYKIKPTSNTDCIAIKFCDGSDYKVFDNNDGAGYFVRTYNNFGNETIASEFGYASGFSDWAAWLGNCARDIKKARELMENVFSKHPEAKIKYMNDYLGLLWNFRRDEGDGNILQVLAEFGKSKELADDNYETLSNYYDRLKKTEKFEEINKIALAKYPNGKLAASLKRKTSYKLFEEEKDINKKWELAKQHNINFPTKKESNMITPEGIVLQEMIKQNKFELLPEWTKYVLKQEYITSGFNAMQLLKAKKGLDIALTFADMRLKEAKEYASTKPKYATESAWEKNSMSALFNTLVMRAKILNELGRKDEALKDYDEAFSVMPLKNLFGEDDITAYLKLMLENKKYENIQPAIEEAIIRGIKIAGMDEAFKEIYIKKNGSDKGYSEYIAKLKSDSKAKSNAKIIKEMISKPSPQFTLTDLKGENVSLADLKGKVVVLDFWATWCGPCKMSFPTMQRAVDRYKDNKDVVFLFVNTWQTEPDKKQNAQKFIDEMKYTFHVILDTEDKVVRDFGVTGIPTKVIIDKKGNICFNVVGAEIGDVALEELSTRIELAGK
ncbi:MAG: redoxin domain-containing protein [Melioribacter sp.]|nr:redoxin domain-containing protein [Melioribacter sp.]